MDAFRIDEKTINEKMAKLILYRERGKVSQSVGLTFEGFLPGATVGSICRVVPPTVHEENADEGIDAEVIGFKNKKVILMPLDEPRGLSTSSKIILSETEATIPVGDFLLGRVINGKAEPIDEGGPLYSDEKHIQRRVIYGEPVNPLDRPRIREPLDLGVRALNGFMTCGKGQRMGIMAGSGVGKSVLLGMMARHTKADVNVIALIGERGREVNEFLDNELGREGLKKSIVVVATSEVSPLLRMRGAFIAATIAEYFCGQGKDVLLLTDSITRFAMAQREIGLSQGEAPASKGYTPSVFSLLPKLLERAGTRTGKGSITALSTVLVEGDDLDEPIADATRSILDGHIVLSRKLANLGHYPAIDVLASVSRVMRSVIDDRHLSSSDKVRELLSIYHQNEDLISIGAYVKGTNKKLDQAVAVIDQIHAYLKQGISESSNLAESILRLDGILRSIEE